MSALLKQFGKIFFTSLDFNNLKDFGLPGQRFATNDARNVDNIFIKKLLETEQAFQGIKLCYEISYRQTVKMFTLEILIHET